MMEIQAMFLFALGLLVVVLVGTWWLPLAALRLPLAGTSAFALLGAEHYHLRADAARLCRC